jgi:hypothetical protein
MVWAVTLEEAEMPRRDVALVARPDATERTIVSLRRESPSTDADV